MRAQNQLAGLIQDVRNAAEGLSPEEAGVKGAMARIANAPKPAHEEPKAPAEEPEKNEAAADEKPADGKKAKKSAKPAPRKNPKQPGRQISKRRLPHRENKTSEPGAISCPNGCGPAEQVGIQFEELVELINSLKDHYGEQSNRIALYYCPRCHKIHALFPEEMQPPVRPGRTISMKLCIEMLNCLAHGLPYNRTDGLMYEKLKLGSNTVIENVRDWATLYGAPLMNAIVGNCPDKVLLADETRYGVLELQGRGVCKPADKTSSSNWMLAVATKHDSMHPFIRFSALKSRSADDIGEALALLAGRIDTLVVDGYAGYVSLMDGILQGIKRQCCLVHARREVYAASTSGNLVKALLELSPEERVEHFRKNMRDGRNDVCLLAVLAGFQLIFGYEAEVAEPLPDETEEAHAARILTHRQTFVKPVYEAIDAIFMEMAKTQTTQVKGRFRSKEDTQAAKAVRYWMNQREHLKVFLEDGRVPLETNTVERGIRPMAVLRKNQGFVQSIDGAKTLAMCMSLAETAKLNGIDVEEWLNDMSKAAFKHAYEKQWTYWYTNEEAPKNPNRKIQDWANMAELLSDFNWADYLPWVWKARKEAEARLQAELAKQAAPQMA